MGGEEGVWKTVFPLAAHFLPACMCESVFARVCKYKSPFSTQWHTFVPMQIENIIKDLPLPPSQPPPAPPVPTPSAELLGVSPDGTPQFPSQLSPTEQYDFG